MASAMPAPAGMRGLHAFKCRPICAFRSIDRAGECETSMNGLPMVAAATISASNSPGRHGCARPGSMAESYARCKPMAEDCVQSVPLHPTRSRPARPWHPVTDRPGLSVADDPLVMHSRLESFRTNSECGSSGGYGSLCDIGHQGLLHDKEFGPASTGLVHNRRRTLNPNLGRFMQRDPLGYPDGMNAYEYVGGEPVNSVDPSGLWEKDFHYDLTLELAKKAGIACAKDVAKNCQLPDEKYPAIKAYVSKVALETRKALNVIPIGPNSQGPTQQEIRKVERQLKLAQDWHLPADKNGKVTPASNAARAKVAKGIKDCDFKLFTMGLHAYQDSWAHQGKPFKYGLGHARGAEYVEEHREWFGLGKKVEAHWKKLTGWRAFLSHSDDKTHIWSEDARSAAIATYGEMIVFKKNCKCACPGKKATSSGKAMAVKDVSEWLKKKFPGKNKVK